MCLAISCFLSALLLAATAHELQYGNQQNNQVNSQWTPFMNFQGQNQQGDQQFQASDYSNAGFDFSAHQIQEDSGRHTLEGHNLGGHTFGGHEFGGHNLQAHSYPVHQHVEEDNPEPIKHYKEVVVPIPKNVEFKINQPIIIPVPHPVPIQIPVPKAIVIPIIKEVAIPVEKSVPYPVTKEVRVPRIKEVPFEVVKHIIVPVEKPFPFKVPVYETIIHTKKGQHKI